MGILVRYCGIPLALATASAPAKASPAPAGPTGVADGWRGRFRRGHPDAVLLRYALERVGKLTGLLISHLDVLDRGIVLKWCERYTNAARLPASSLASRPPPKKCSARRRG